LAPFCSTDLSPDHRLREIDRERVARATAEGVNFAVDRGYGNRTERRAHGSKFLPLICRWVVCQGDDLRVRMNEIGKTTKDVKLAVQADGTGMT